MASSSSANHFITQARVLAVLSLILVWTLASLLPHYKSSIRTSLAASTAYLPNVPAVRIDYHPNSPPSTKFNSTKLAVIIESRPLPHLVPQLLHMISVVPYDWRFLFIGSDKSIFSVGRAPATQVQRADGKLDLKKVPGKWDIESKEGIHRMLTDTKFYDEMLPGVEWMLKFEADSIMCSNSGESLNNWLHYSWAGATKSQNEKFAGVGGLSLRRISAIKQVLSFQSRYNDSEPEDHWFGRRVMLLPGALVATEDQENHFSVESIWHEKPLGYHVADGGTKLPEAVWKSREQRKKIFEYCPELSMIMPMKLERERCDG